MPKYAITEKAGRFVAGHTNTGIGTELDLTERAAAYEVALGTLVLVGGSRPQPAQETAPEAAAPPPEAPAAEPAAVVEPAPAAPPAPKRRGRKTTSA